MYRIDETDKHNRRRRHLAEVRDSSDEAARRTIIHKTVTAGGHVHVIIPAEGHEHYPGESAKKVY